MQRVHVTGQELEGLPGWLFARFRAFTGVRTAEPRQMRLLEILPLGGKRQLMLVECGEHRFLVGGGLETVQTIVPVSRETEVCEIAEPR